MIKMENLVKYLEETGLSDRISNIKPGDSFGVELPMDEENKKWLRFWLSEEDSEGETYLSIDFEGLVKMRVNMDEKKLVEWMDRSGMGELGEAIIVGAEEPKTAE